VPTSWQRGRSKPLLASLRPGLRRLPPAVRNKPQQPPARHPPQPVPHRPFAPKEIAAQHEEPAPAATPQVGAEGEIYDPPFFRKGLSRPDGSGGFGPMASSDFGNDLDIPTVIRNLSD